MEVMSLVDMRAVLICAVALLGCGPAPESSVTPEVSASKASEPDDAARWFLEALGISHLNETICQSEVSVDTPPLVIFDNLMDRGGATCHAGTHIEVFYRSKDGQCHIDRPDAISTRSVVARNVYRSFVDCLPISKPSSHKNTGVILITPSEAELAKGAHDYFVFYNDLIGLAARDALAITHLGFMSNVICMETADPEAVVEHIEKAEIVDGTIAEYTIEWGTCRTLGAELAGGSWPEVVPYED